MRGIAQSLRKIQLLRLVRVDAIERTWQGAWCEIIKAGGKQDGRREGSCAKLIVQAGFNTGRWNKGSNVCTLQESLLYELGTNQPVWVNGERIEK